MRRAGVGEALLRFRESGCSRLIVVDDRRRVSPLVCPNGVQADSEGAESLRTVLEVISLIKTQYVEDVDTIALISGYIETGTINGMLEAAIDDPYTRYMDARRYEQMQIDTHGRVRRHRDHGGHQRRQDDDHRAL